MKALQKSGGLAALGHATALVVGLVLSFTMMFPLSLAAVRTGDLPRAPGYLGVFLGIVESLTMLPALAEAMFMIFGPGMMAWSALVGIVMLRSRDGAA